MEYSVGDLLKYTQTDDIVFICKVIKIAYGYAWWCLDGEETTPSRYFTKSEQYVRLESINCDWTNSCISSTEQLEPYQILTRKNVKKHEWISV
jgi:hypothetical protein